MDDFVAHDSRPRITVLILIALGFVALGLWMVGMFGAPPASRKYPLPFVVAIGWFSVTFFGACGLAAIRRLILAGERLRIGPVGIHWKPWSDQTIPWGEITDVTSWTFKREQSIVLHLADPSRFPAKELAAAMSGANRAITGGDVSISLTGTDRSFAEAWAAIERFRALG